MRNWTVILLASVLTAGCAASTTPLHPGRASSAPLPPEALAAVAEPPATDSPLEIDAQQKGRCSWYGPRFHGRRTSSGEIFDKHALTAAHPSLPFGSRVEVTDVVSGRKVQVRINDRGPFTQQRIIDLSYGAASTLDIVGRGVADVELRLVEIGSGEATDEVFAVEVGSFDTRSGAESFVAGLSAAQRAAGLYYVKAPDAEARAYRVRFGPFPCEATARTAVEQLKRRGLRASLLRENLGGEADVASRRRQPLVR